MKKTEEKIINTNQKKTSVKQEEAFSVEDSKEKKVSKKTVLSKRKPEKNLVLSLKRKAGRNSRGVITVRHRGGGPKRLYRIVDFKRVKYDVPGEVLAIEYDPSRSAFIALLKYPDGEKSYILAPEGLKAGKKVVSSDKKVKSQVGNRMSLKDIPLGTAVHDVELTPGKGGQIVRSAGTGAVLLAKDGGFIHLKMPSSEVRMIKEEAKATVGTVSNPEHGKEVIGKAGRKRHMGIRPGVRGKAMNPVDHPHGGGEGKQPIGLKHPKTPWGAPALGYRTRKSKSSDKFIVRRRRKK